MNSAVAGLLFTAASLCAVGEVAAAPVSAWKNLPKPPSKFHYGDHGKGHFHSKCGHMDICEECVHKHGVWKIEPKEAGTLCSDAFYCNGEEKCDGAGHCMEGMAPVCGPGSVENVHIEGQCADYVCSERHKSCKVAITPGDCDDGKHCTDYDQCDLKTGKCRGIPKVLGSKCDSCDPDTGETLTCDNDDDQVCQHGKCVAKPCDLEEAIPVTCYKCGDQQVQCLVVGDLEDDEKLDIKLRAIEHAILDTCEPNNNGKKRTCGRQPCTNGIVVELAPLVTQDAEMASIAGGESPPVQCLRVAPDEGKFKCPCKIGEKRKEVDNIAQYKVCLSEEGHKVKAVVLTEEGGCARVCDNNDSNSVPACDSVDLCHDGNCVADASCNLGKCHAPSY